MMKQSGSVLARLAVSYLTLVAVIALLLCSIFYMYVPRNYNEEIAATRSMALERAAELIGSSYIARVNQIYVNLSLGAAAEPASWSESTLQGRHSKVLDILDSLKFEVAGHTDIVEAIHLLYPGLGAVISSEYGLSYEGEGDSRQGVEEAVSLVEEMKQEGTRMLWSGPQSPGSPLDEAAEGFGVAAAAPALSYVHSYPFNAPAGQAGLYIVMDLKETALADMLAAVMPSGDGRSLLIDEQGMVVSAADKSLLGHQLSIGDEAVTLPFPVDEAAGRLSETYGGVEHIVSYHRLEGTPWTVIDATPSIDYYDKSIALQQTVLLLCLLAVAIGGVLSGVFTAASYTPVKRLLHKVKHLFDGSAGQQNNEFGLIGNALDRLTDQVSQLEETLEANRPAIRQHVLFNLLHNRYRAAEIGERMESVGLSADFRYFCCLAVEPADGAFGALGSKEGQYVSYRLIRRLEAAGGPDVQVVAGQLPDETFAVLVGVNDPDPIRLQSLYRLIEGERTEEPGVAFRTAPGRWVRAPEEAHASFEEAHKLVRYGFLLDARPVLEGEELLKREASHDEIPQRLLLKFGESLRGRSPEGLQEAVDELAAEMRGGPYSYDYCRFILLNTVSVYSDYCISIRYTPPGTPDNVKMDLVQRFNALHSLGDFRQWLLSSASAMFAETEKRSGKRNTDGIALVKAYVDEHLEGDLSLDAAAGRVYLSPKYLSKLFKEETGMTYTDYVTGRRMKRAEELLLQENVTIEQIAGMCGYGNSAYFIKKFKEIYGVTPNHYRRQQQEEAG